MSYLIYSDYRRLIQSDNLQQIISSDMTVLSAAERAAIAESQSYLKQKYDVSKEFDETMLWSIAKAYNAGDRVYLDATAYNAASTYALGVLVLQSGNVYKCTTAIVTPEAFNGAKWTVIGAQYDIYSAALPKPEFDYGRYYNVNDDVFWKDFTYKCKIQTPYLDHDTAIQYREIENLPQKNVAPDDVIQGATYWGNKTAYSIAAGTLPTDAAKWVALDNRDQQMVVYLIDITLYHIHSRIAPRNIPELRVKRYDDAIAWLKMCAKGDVTPNLPLIKPMQGNRIRYGGGIKLINTY